MVVSAKFQKTAVMYCRHSAEVSKYYLFPKEIIAENVVNINTSQNSKYDGYTLHNLRNILTI